MWFFYFFDVVMKFIMFELIFIFFMVILFFNLFINIVLFFWLFFLILIIGFVFVWFWMLVIKFKKGILRLFDEFFSRLVVMDSLMENLRKLFFWGMDSDKFLFVILVLLEGIEREREVIVGDGGVGGVSWVGLYVGKLVYVWLVVREDVVVGVVLV